MQLRFELPHLDPVVRYFDRWVLRTGLKPVAAGKSGNWQRIDKMRQRIWIEGGPHPLSFERPAVILHQRCTDQAALSKKLPSRDRHPYTRTASVTSHY